MFTIIKVAYLRCWIQGHHTKTGTDHQSLKNQKHTLFQKPSTRKTRSKFKNKNKILVSRPFKDAEFHSTGVSCAISFVKGFLLTTGDSKCVYSSFWVDSSEILKFSFL